MPFTYIIKKIKRNQNANLMVLLFLVIAGYSFFFVSSFIIPGSSKVEATPLYEYVQTQDSNSIRLMRAEYSEQEKQLQIEFDIKEATLRPYTYEIRVRNRVGTVVNVPIDIVMAVDDINIINANNIMKNWTEIQISVIGMNDGKVQSIAKMYVDRSNINILPEIAKNKSHDDYRADKTYKLMEENLQKINETREKINSTWYEIGLLKQQNDDIIKKQKYQTEAEKNISNAAMDNNISTINSYFNDINKKEDEIKELNEKIKKSREFLESINKPLS